MRKLWHSLTVMGLKDTKSLQYNREIILLNKINALIAAIMLIELVLEFILYFLELNNLNISTIRIFLIALICVFNIFLCSRRYFNLAKLLLIVFMPFMLFAFPLIVGFFAPEIYLWYPYAAIAFSVVPLLILRPDKDKGVITFSLIYISIYIFWIDLFALFIGVPNFVNYDAPRLIFTKLAQAGIFAVLISSVRYLININRQYEDQLLVANDDIVKKSQLLNEKAFELTQQNDLLNKSREELRKKNKALSEYQQELSNQNEELIATMEELKSTQLQLIQSEKMASLGVITAGIAHEINNPINFVSSNTEGLKTLVDDLVNFTHELKNNEINQDEFNKEVNEIQQGAGILVQNINKGIKRTTEIIKGLSKFSHIESDELELCDINDYINSTLALISGQFRDRIEVTTQFATIYPIQCYPSALGQIIMNLVTNAIQAISGNGKIQITTAIENKNVRIEVTDTGYGIPLEVGTKIFEPFYTSKGFGKGTGLGLSITYNLVKKHLGSINYTSEIGIGTKFIILIPTDLGKRINSEKTDQYE
jgi:signal transduction histidine kinase